jgi:hypothetical protein
MRRFTVDEYHRMIQAGILTEDDPVELVEGWIVLKMPHNPPHDGTVDQDREVIQSRLPPGWRIRVQSAITLSESEPEPDLTVVPGPASRYFDHHPGPQEIALVVEVSDSSLACDRQEKARMYARARLVCYWIVNLVDRQVEVYTDPSGPGRNPSYRQQQTYGPTDAVPLVIGGQEVARIPAQELLP